MSRLLRRFLCSSSSTPAAGTGADFVAEFASLLTAGRFHASVGLAKSLLSSQPPAASIPDLYHALASAAVFSPGGPEAPSFLCDAASALVVPSARLRLPDGALRLLSLLVDARAPLPSLSSRNLLLESLISLGRHVDVHAAFELLGGTDTSVRAGFGCQLLSGEDEGEKRDSLCTGDEERGIGIPQSANSGLRGLLEGEFCSPPVEQ